MENYKVGEKLTESQLTNELIFWLDKTQHYLLDINEGEYKYQITKTKELSHQEQLDYLRERRQAECFPIINRGKIWYDSLSESQAHELVQFIEEERQILSALKQYYLDELKKVLPERQAIA